MSSNDRDVVEMVKKSIQCAFVGLQRRGKEIRHSGARGGCLSQPQAPEREYIEERRT